jgi:hypothetical protein
VPQSIHFLDALWVEGKSSTATGFFAAGRWFIMIVLGTGFAAIGFLVHKIAFGDVNGAGAVLARTGNKNGFYHKTHLRIDTVTIAYPKNGCQE